MDNIFDYSIIGSGPAGLTIGWILSQYGKKVIIIDREDAIGGCHRVRRINNLFTEHGPRIYSSAYINTRKWFETMNLDFFDYFIPYEFNLANIGGKTIKNMKLYEIFWLTYETIKSHIYPNHSKSITCLNFMIKHKFTSSTIDYIDRLCRLTDGAGADKYTLYEFVKLLDYNALYKIYQPNKSSDNGFLKDIRQKLVDNNVMFSLNNNISSISINNNICYTKNKNGKVIKSKNIIFAVPPSNLLTILNNSSIDIKHSFGDWTNLYEWSKHNEYNVYVSITYHWNKKINLPKVWGFPSSSWGIAFINLSDYMSDINETIISCCITKPNTKSNKLGKTIDQCSKDELIDETFRQLKLAFPQLPKPIHSIISPGDYYDNNKWSTIDTAYMMTTDATKKYPIQFKSPKHPNLFSLGTHNKLTPYPFTSMESAVTNAFELAHMLTPEASTKYIICSPFSLVKVVFVIIIIIIAIYLIIQSYFL